MADIIDLGFGSKFAQQEPSEKVVKVLERYLALAKKGDIQALAIIGMTGAEEPLMSTFQGTCRFGPMFGALKILEIDLTTQFHMADNLCNLPDEDIGE